MRLVIRDLLPTYFQEEIKKTSEIWGREHSFDKGDLVKIVAPSGSGKSSLINFLYGLRKDFMGEVLYDGKHINKFNAEELATLRKNHVSIVFQDLRLFPEQTALENLEIKRQLNPFHPPQKIHEMAERLGIADRLSTPARICSYGEQQRIAIIRSLLQPYDILLLDEPFSHLDDNNAQKAMALMLEESQRRQATIIFADLERIDFFPSTRLYHL